MPTNLTPFRYRLASLERVADLEEAPREGQRLGSPPLAPRQTPVPPGRREQNKGKGGAGLSRVAGGTPLAVWREGTKGGKGRHVGVFYLLGDG
jgi:hypothetical protein